MNIDKLVKLKEEAEIKIRRINKLLSTKAEIEQAIEDLKYIEKYSGEMILTANNGKIGERDILLRKVNVNLLAGCVAVPKLLLELAENRLKKIEKEVETLN